MSVGGPRSVVAVFEYPVMADATQGVPPAGAAYLRLVVCWAWRALLHRRKRGPAAVSARMGSSGNLQTKDEKRLTSGQRKAQ